MDKRFVPITVSALLPAVITTLKFPVQAAGRMAWLCPLALLPVRFLLSRIRRGREGTFLEKPPDPVGRLLAVIYLAWGMALLWGSASSSAGRLLRSLGSGGRRWVILLTALLLTLYLTRRTQILTRAGKLFLPTVVVLLVTVLLLSVPGIHWENLLPVNAAELRGLPVGMAWALSLSGYGVYAAFLSPQGKEGRGSWIFWTCAAMSALLMVLTGVFGPALILRMDQPFLYLLSGAGVPGAFQRGEALLMALAALGDLALLGLLAQSCARLWQYLFGKAGWIPTAVGFALALVNPETGTAIVTGWTGLWGNLILGTGIPVLAAWAGKRRPEEKTGPHFVGGK